MGQARNRAAKNEPGSHFAASQAVARIFLGLTVGLGVLLIYGRWAKRPIPTVTISGAEPKPAAPVPARPPVTALAAGGSVNESRPEHRTPLIAQLARIEVRRRLALAGPTVYLDSLLVGPDSVIRRWGEGTVLRVLIGRPPNADPVVEAVGEALRMWEDLRLGPEETRSVALPEFGHALGLPHSGRPSDIMFPTVSVLRLSDRDRSSAQLLYAILPGALREPRPP